MTQWLGRLRTALRDPDAWWVGLVKQTFSFLEEDFGYHLSEVKLHFRGNYITYDGPDYRFVIEYDSDSTGSLGAEFVVIADLARGSRVRSLPVTRLLEARSPDENWGPPEPNGPQTPEVVASTLRRWADGLRLSAADVLAGAPAVDVAWEYLW